MANTTGYSTEVNKNLAKCMQFEALQKSAFEKESVIHKDTNKVLEKSSSAPRGGSVHTDVPLTNFSLKWMQDVGMFVALRAAPNLSTPHRSNSYYIFDKDDFFRDEMNERAGGTESSGSGFQISDDTYFCKKYSVHKDVTDDDEDDADMVLDLRMSAAEYVSQKTLIKLDSLFADRFLKASVWDNDNTSSFWSGTNSTDPIEDIISAKTAVHRKSGFRPNRLVIGQEVYDKLATDDSILARITGGSTNMSPAQVTPMLIAALFGLDALEVAGGVRNTAKRKDTASNQAANTNFIVGDVGLLYYAPAGIGPNSVTAMTRFGWSRPGYGANGLQIKRFYIDEKESTRIEANLCVDFKVNASEMGYFFTDLVR